MMTPPDQAPDGRQSPEEREKDDRDWFRERAVIRGGVGLLAAIVIVGSAFVGNWAKEGRDTAQQADVTSSQTKALAVKTDRLARQTSAIADGLVDASCAIVDTLETSRDAARGILEQTPEDSPTRAVRKAQLEQLTQLIDKLRLGVECPKHKALPTA